MKKGKMKKRKFSIFCYYTIELMWSVLARLIYVHTFRYSINNLFNDVIIQVVIG